jgi:hypothetical protein
MHFRRDQDRSDKRLSVADRDGFRGGNHGALLIATRLSFLGFMGFL